MKLHRLEEKKITTREAIQKKDILLNRRIGSKNKKKKKSRQKSK
jgi:hypothetical protein